MGKVATPAHARRTTRPASEAVQPAPPVDPDFVEFMLAGTALAGEFRCAECGYGVVVPRLLPRCPMCRGAVWEQRGPLARRPAAWRQSPAA